MAAVPKVPEGNLSVWAQYTIRVKDGTREAFAESLKAKGIPTAIYYPKSMHQQTAYRHFPVADGGLPVCEKLSRECISLPMHPYLDTASQDRVISAVRDAVRG